MDQLFQKYADVDPENEEQALTAKGWENLCKKEDLWQVGGRDLVNDFFGRRGGKWYRLPSSYEELLRDWDSIKERFKVILDKLNDEPLMIYFERISNSILVQDHMSQKKIWMNYKLLEAEIERIDLLGKIQQYLPDQIDLLDNIIQVRIAASP